MSLFVGIGRPHLLGGRKHPGVVLDGILDTRLQREGGAPFFALRGPSTADQNEEEDPADGPTVLSDTTALHGLFASFVSRLRDGSRGAGKDS